MKSITFYNLKDQLHRKDGPAYLEYYENGQKYCEHFCLNGKFHNENGQKNDESFWLNGRFLSKEEWQEQVNPKPKTVTIEFEVDGQKVSVSKDDLVKLLNSAKS